MTSTLFSPISLRDLTLSNRIVVSPMCQYNSNEGSANDWHLVHLGGLSMGAAGLVIFEMTNVSPEGRISPRCATLCSDENEAALKRVVDFCRTYGVAKLGIQLGHAGRKGSQQPPALGGKALTAEEGAWETVGPSAIPFGDYPAPRELTRAEMADLVEAHRQAVARAERIGFDLIEMHGGHGYLIHQFLSPLANQRTDEYGGSLENRMRLPLRIVEGVREIWPAKWLVFVRISATDWAPGGWDLPQSIEFSRRLKERGIDLIDCSSGGAVPGVKIPVGPGYQVPFSEAIRKEAGIATGAVGLITEPAQAQEIIASGQADIVLLARELLRDPYWPLHAAAALGVDVPWPVQYERAKYR